MHPLKSAVKLNLRKNCEEEKNYNRVECINCSLLTLTTKNLGKQKNILRGRVFPGHILLEFLATCRASHLNESIGEGFFLMFKISTILGDVAKLN